MNLIIINYNNKKIKIWSDICITSLNNQSKIKKKIKILNKIKKKDVHDINKCPYEVMCLFAKLTECEILIKRKDGQSLLRARLQRKTGRRRRRLLA
jgi:hypothetical protein